MTTRRDFLIGGASIAAAGVAYARTPRNRMSLLGKGQIATLLPKQFGEWHEVPSDALVVPQSDESLAAKLYSQNLAGYYESAETGDGVMMLIAYGDTQSDQLQLHRPEVCYPAFGFNVVRTVPAAITIASGVAVPARSLTAASPSRTEQIAYWTRIGEYLPQTGSDQRMAKLNSAFDGLIPDGVLVRLSNLVPDADAALALNQRFASAMLAAVAPKNRAALIGTALARKFSGQV
jgi:EpsI family protein